MNLSRNLFRIALSTPVALLFLLVAFLIYYALGGKSHLSECYRKNFHKRSMRRKSLVLSLNIYEFENTKKMLPILVFNIFKTFVDCGGCMREMKTLPREAATSCCGLC